MLRLASRKIRPSVALGLALLSPTATTNALSCSSDDKGSSWNQLSEQLGEGVYWDKLAKQAGMKVRET